MGARNRLGYLGRKADITFDKMTVQRFVHPRFIKRHPAIRERSHLKLINIKDPDTMAHLGHADPRRQPDIPGADNGNFKSIICHEYTVQILTADPAIPSAT